MGGGVSLAVTRGEEGIHPGQVTVTMTKPSSNKRHNHLQWESLAGGYQVLGGWGAHFSHFDLAIEFPADVLT